MSYDSTSVSRMPYYGGYQNYFGNDSTSSDFMYNATLPQGGTNYSGSSGLTMPSQLTSDTYQPQQASGGGDVVSSALWAGGVGGATYYLGKKFFSNSVEPVIKDGKVPESLLQAYDKEQSNLAKEFDALKEAELKKIASSREFQLTPNQYEALKQFAKDNVPKSSLAKIYQDELQALNINSNAEAFEKITKINEKVDLEKLQQKAINNYKAKSYIYKTQQLNRFNSAKSLIEGLASDCNQEDIRKLIRENPNKFFDTSGLSEDRIRLRAEKIANAHGQSRASILTYYEKRVKNAKKAVESSRTALETTITDHWSDSTKAFKSTAPKELQNAISHTGGSKMKLIAGVVAGATFLYNWLGGKNS